MKHLVEEWSGEDGEETADDSDETNTICPLGEPPMAWGASYSDQRDLVFVSDFLTGAWTSKITPGVADGNGGGNGNSNGQGRGN